MMNYVLYKNLIILLLLNIQIKDYLESSNEYIDRIVILDDNDEGISQYFDEEFIQVNRFYGLTNEVCDKIKKVLL